MAAGTNTDTGRPTIQPINTEWERNDDDPMILETDTDLLEDDRTAHIRQDLEDFEQRREQMGIPLQGPTIEEMYNAGGYRDNDDSNVVQPPTPPAQPITSFWGG